MNKVVFIGVAILLVALVVAVVYYFGNFTGFSVKNDNSGAVVQSGDVRVISISAEKFDYTPGTITVKKGENIKIMVNNVDTKHGIAIPDLKVNGIDSVEFTADKVGTYEFYCPTFCGSGHREMKGTLIVEE